jgi:hypothetical protein
VIRKEESEVAVLHIGQIMLLMSSIIDLDNDAVNVRRYW